MEHHGLVLFDTDSKSMKEKVPMYVFEMQTNAKVFLISMNLPPGFLFHE